MIRQIQYHFYNGRFNTIDGEETLISWLLPGASVYRVGTPAGSSQRGIEMMANSKVRFFWSVIDPENYVYPIMTPGCSNIEMMYERLA